MHWTGNSVLRPCPEPCGGALDFQDRLTRKAWRTAWRRLQVCAPRDGLGAMLSHTRQNSSRSPLTAIIISRARFALPQLLQSTRQFDTTSSICMALPLIGAGPGLTPSWDDLLIGLLCGLRATCGDSWRKSRFAIEFGGAISNASVRTTAVSRTYIHRTAMGKGPTWIEDVLKAIAAGDAVRAHSAADQALRIGHTSGTDMMLGAILGSSVWQIGGELNEVLSALLRGCSNFGECAASVTNCPERNGRHEWQ